MDDPWGSPWTTPHTDNKDPKPPSSPSKSTRSDLEPPPRAFLSVTSSPRIPAIPGQQSPWADDDDDGFGDWAAAAADPGQSTPSGWGGGWASPNPGLTTPARDNDFGKESPIAWPGSIAIPKPTSSSIRQSSPDPWATDFADPARSNDGPTTPRPTDDILQTSSLAVDDLGATNIVVSDWDDHAISNSVEKEDNTPRDTSVVSLPKESPVVIRETDNPKEPIARDKSPRPSHASPVRGRKRRSPSPSDDETDRDDDRQDSPITSIDEDSRARQEVARKTSGKVQELVNKFDGLARTASQEPPLTDARERSKSAGPGRTSGSDSPGDFGVFEDVAQDEPFRRLATPDGPGAARELEPTAETPVANRRATEEPISPPSTFTTPESKRQSLAKIASAGFTVDLGKVDELFAHGPKLSHLTDEATQAETDIPDRIITDSFTEISERKTWYRISRLGSSRMHNAGDDENYRRVGWGSSTVRVDTIKIVRRWMEEDSIAGRANLGGGTSKAQKNMFGWDSSAEPVTLDAVFGKKKAHSRHSSLQAMKPLQPPAFASPAAASTTDTRKTPGSIQDRGTRPLSVALPGAASFGWSTATPTAVTSPVTTKSPSKRTPAVRTPSLEKPLPKPAVQPLAPAQPASRALPKPPPIAPPVDDDDEWGEMVASPSASQPAAKGFLDLADAFSAPPPPIPETSKATTTAPSFGVSGGPFQISTQGPVESSSDAWASADFSIFDKPAEIQKQEPARAQPNKVLTNNLITSAFAISPAPTTPFTPANVASSSLLAASASATPISAPASSKSASHFTPTTPLHIASPIALPTSAVTDSGSQNTTNTTPIQQDEAVLRIIANLPDLSYMLR